jgi:murein L,D-transpeptidase YafK
MLLLVFALTAMLSGMYVEASDFRGEQKRYSRVRAAYAATDSILPVLFAEAGVKYPPKEIYLRAFKHEEELELWARAESADSFVLVTTWDFTAYSGTLGPKRAQGDLQIPEGCYFTDRFNPASRFHLSLGLSYPNRSDRIRKRGPDPGGDIFIHGNRVTIGCIPIGDEKIQELYIVAVEARNSGQGEIPVHIFPCRFDDSANAVIIEHFAGTDGSLADFWAELESIYSFFEQYRSVPEVSILSDGSYQVRGDGP